MTNEELTKLRQERGKQVLNIGDKVIVHSASDKPLYDGKVATIIEKGILGSEVYYGLYIEGVTVEKRSTPLIGKSEIIGNTSLLAPRYAEDLELVKEPKPKFKVGDKVVVTSDNDSFVPYIGKIVHLNEGSADITVGRGRINVPIDRLVPYIEPTADEGEEKLQSRLDNADSASSILNILREETVPTPAWQSYCMELAAKIAVAYAEKGRYEPYEIIAKAVEVADGVVERLKNSEVCQ